MYSEIGRCGGCFVGTGMLLVYFKHIDMTD